MKGCQVDSLRARYSFGLAHLGGDEMFEDIPNLSFDCHIWSFWLEGDDERWYSLRTSHLLTIARQIVGGALTGALPVYQGGALDVRISK